MSRRRTKVIHELEYADELSRRGPGVSPALMILAGAALVMLTLAAFAPCVHGNANDPNRPGFVWDDDTFLYNNPLILDDGGLLKFWSLGGLFDYLTHDKSKPLDVSGKPFDYFPLVYSMMWIEWRLFGMDARGYHIINILLHAASAVLLWRVLREMGVPGAWVAAAVFAVHPVNVESVAWITERKNTLPMVFYLLSIWWHLLYERTGRRGWYRASLGAFVLALLGKTSVVTLPFVLLIVTWWRRRRLTARDVKGTIPYFLLAFVFGCITIFFQYQHAIQTVVVREDSFWSRLAIAGMAVWFYLYKAIFPAGLCFNYPYWRIDAGQWMNYLPAAAVVCVLSTLWLNRRRWGAAGFAAFAYYVVTLFPVLGFFNIYFMRYSLVADHWQYTSIIGMIVLLVGGGAWFAARRGGAMEVAGIVLAAMLSTALFVQSFRLSMNYRSMEALFYATLECNPGAWMISNNLGNLHLHRHEYKPALEHFERAVASNANYYEALNNLGLTYQFMAYDAKARGDGTAWEAHLKRALEYFEEALKCNPNAAIITENVKSLFFDRKDFAAAIAYYQRKTEEHPTWPDMFCFLADSKIKLAEQLLQGELPEPPTNPAARLAELDQAKREEILKLKDDAVTLFNHALNLYEDLIVREPRRFQAFQNMANTKAILSREMMLVGDDVQRTVGAAEAAKFYEVANVFKEQAAQLYLEVMRIEPKHVNARLNLGNMFLANNRCEQAAVMYREVLEIDPAHEEAKQNLLYVEENLSRERRDATFVKPQG